MAAWQKDSSFGPFTFYRGYSGRGGWLLIFQIDRFVIRIGLEPTLLL